MRSSVYPAGAGVPASEIISREDAEKSPLRVLVVDDEHLVRWSLAESLGQAGYDVVEARDARTARDLLDRSGRIDIALLDLKLPDGTGLRLIPDIRARHRGCTILVMTSYATPDVIDAALAAGAVAVIPKPFDLDHLARIVGEHAPGA